MYQFGIFTGLDLKSKSYEFLETNFGKSGVHYYHIVRGIHNSEVKPNRTTKSVAAEHTFDHNLTSEIFMAEKLEQIASEVGKRLAKHGISGKTAILHNKRAAKRFLIILPTKGLCCKLRSNCCTKNALKIRYDCLVLLLTI